MFLFILTKKGKKMEHLNLFLFISYDTNNNKNKKKIIWNLSFFHIFWHKEKLKDEARGEEILRNEHD